MTGYVSVLLTNIKNQTLCKKKLNIKGLQMGKGLSLLLLEPSISGISRRHILPNEMWKDKSRNRVFYLSFLIQVDRLKVTHVICFSLMLCNSLFGGHSSFPSGKILSK